MKAKHAIQLYKDHVATLNGMIEDVKDDIDRFLKNALKGIESSQHDEETNTLANLEDQLKNL